MWGTIGRISFVLSCAASSFAFLALFVGFGHVFESEVTTAAILCILGIQTENERRSVPPGSTGALAGRQHRRSSSRLAGVGHAIVVVLDRQGGAPSQPNVTDRLIPCRKPERSDLLIFVVNLTLLRPDDGLWAGSASIWVTAKSIPSTQTLPR
jgi:hypothetical protein